MFSRIPDLSLVRLVASLIVVFAMSGCAERPRIKYDLTVENRTGVELANVRVSIDHTSSGARFGFLVPKGQATFGLFNTPVNEGYLLRNGIAGGPGEWSSWLPFKTEQLRDGWDGEIRLVVEENVVRLQIEAKGGATSIVAEAPQLRTNAGAANEVGR